MPAPTLQSLTTRITRDYLNRTDLDNETVRAIQAAVRHYEHKRFPWNQTSVTLTASVGAAVLSIPVDFLALDLLEVRVDSANYELVTSSFASIRRMNAINSPRNFPQNFATRGEEFHLSPVPDSAYSITCHYVKQLPALDAASMGATNAWLSACEDVLAYHAAKLIWANVLRNDTEAAKYDGLEKLSWGAVVERRDQAEHGGIVPTSF